MILRSMKMSPRSIGCHYEEVQLGMSMMSMSLFLMSLVNMASCMIRRDMRSERKPALILTTLTSYMAIVSMPSEIHAIPLFVHEVRSMICSRHG